MVKISDCVEVFESILNKDYIIKLENGIALKIFFQPRHFYHMLGLHKLRDVDKLDSQKIRPATIYYNIKDGLIKDWEIRESNRFNLIKDRVDNFYNIVELLESRKIIVDFDPNVLEGKTNLQNTKYILYKNIDASYIHLTIAEKQKSIYPETFFVEHGKRYIDKQVLLEILGIQIITHSKRKKEEMRKTS